MDKITSYIFVFVFFLLFIALAAVYLYYRYIKLRYTRERFAFFGVSTLATFSIFGLTLLFARNPILSTLVSLYNQSFASNIQLPDTTGVSFEAILLFIACLFMLWYTINNLHHRWDGVVSTRQAGFSDTLQAVSIFGDARFYLKVIQNKEEIKIYQQEEKKKRDVFGDNDPDRRPWYERAKNLFNLLDRQYDISEEDWYGEHQCYIARYGQEEERIGILCVEHPPENNTLDAFLKFVKTKNGEFHKLIIAISEEGESSLKEYGGQRLEYRYETELLDSLLSLSEYRRYIKGYFNQRKLENSELRLADMYVPLGGHKMGIEKEKLIREEALLSVETYVLDWLKDSQQNKNEHLAILGDYGQGKTVLTHKIIKEILAHPEEYSRVPILIELRGLSPRNDDEFGILGHWAKLFKAQAEALWELHRAGKLFIILDGFDEMDLVGDTELLFNHFAQLWRLARVPNAKILITGRPNLFENDKERRRALGIQSPRNYLPYARAIYLDKLTDPQIEKVLRNTQAATKQGILQALKASTEDSSFAELITRPSTLYQLSTVWDSELAKYKDRLNSAVVIGSFLNKTYERQQQKEANILTSFERDYFLTGIAVGMMLKNGYTNQIKHKDLEELVKQLWTNYPEKLPAYKDGMEGATALENLKTRLRQNEKALETILKDVRVGGVLVQDLSGRDLFKFAHKSYLEYLISVFIAGYRLKSDYNPYLLMKVNAIVMATGFSQARLLTSPDVEQFTAELIAAQIEIKDQEGNPLPVKGNEAAYAKSLFKQLIIDPYPILGRFFPKLTGWLSIHIDQKFFALIGLTSIASLITFLLTTNDTLKLSMVWLNTICCFCWGGVLLSYRWKPDRLHKIKPSPFLTNSKLYLAACRLMDLPETQFPPSYKLLMEAGYQNAAYKEIRFALLAYFILLSGAFAGAGAVAFAGAGAVAVAVAFAGAVAVAVAGAGAGAVAGAVAGAGAGAVAGAGVGAGLGVGVGAGVGAGLGAGVGVGAGFYLYKIRKTYYIPAIQTLEQAATEKQEHSGTGGSVGEVKK